MGTIFVAGAYGVGKSTLCKVLSDTLAIPAFSAGDLISQINGEKYGANKAVKDKEKNQEILAMVVRKKLEQHPRMLLAGHFCIFNTDNCVEELPHHVFKQIDLEQILLLEAEPERILFNLGARDKKEYKREHIELLLRKENQAAKDVSQKCGCRLHVHQMTFDISDLQKCSKYIGTEV